MANNIPTQDDIDTDELKKQSLRDVVGEGSKILLTKAAARNDGGFIAPYQVTNSIAEVANQHYSGELLEMLLNGIFMASELYSLEVYLELLELLLLVVL